MDKKSLLMLATGAVLATSLFASLFVFQIVAPTQTAQIPKQIQASQPLEKFKAYNGGRDWEVTFSIIDAGKEKGIWARHGLNPEWVDPPAPSSGFSSLAKQLVEGEGVKIGFVVSTDLLLARSKGAPVKYVAGIVGQTGGNRLYTSADSTIKTVKDLDGKKIGVASLVNPEYRNTLYIANKFGIKPDLVLTGNLTNSVVALKLSKVDAFYSFHPAALRLVDSGELRVLARLADFQPTPYASGGRYAAEDIIEKNPELVQRFVKATLEIGKLLNENPAYKAELYQKRTNAPRDVAEKSVSELFYAPEGRGRGNDLVAGVRNHWQFNKESGAIPANIDVKVEDAVDVRFLP